MRLPTSTDSQTDSTGDAVTEDGDSETHAHSSCGVDETTGRSITTLDFDHYFVEEGRLDAMDALPKQGTLLGVDLMASDNGSLSRSETTVGEALAADVEKKVRQVDYSEKIAFDDNAQRSATGSSNVDGLMALLRRMGDKSASRSESKNRVTAPRNVDASGASQDARAIITRLQNLTTPVPGKIQLVQQEEEIDEVAQKPITALDSRTIPEQGDSSPICSASDDKQNGAYLQLPVQSNNIEIDSDEESCSNEDSQKEDDLLHASDDIELQSRGPKGKDHTDGLAIETQNKKSEQNSDNFEPLVSEPTEQAGGNDHHEINHADDCAGGVKNEESGVAGFDNENVFITEDSENFSESDASDDGKSSVDDDENNDSTTEPLSDENVNSVQNIIPENQVQLRGGSQENEEMKEENDGHEETASTSSVVADDTQDDEIGEKVKAKDPNYGKEEWKDAKDVTGQEKKDEDNSDSARDADDHDSEAEETEDEDDFDADNAAFLPSEYLQTPSLPTNPMSLDLLLEDCDGYSDSSSDDSEYTDSSGGISYGSSDGDSDDDLSDEEYDDLMSSMPIALGRSTEDPPRAPLQKPAPPPLTVPEVPFGGGEGLDLSMLASLRTELQKVGTMIAFNKEGEKFVRRAHILASINNLASNIPACVISHLGQETRDQLLKKEAKSMFETSRPMRRRLSINGVVDLSSGADSAAGSSDADSIDSSFSDQNRAEDRGQRRRLVRRISAESLGSASGESLSAASPNSGENSCSSLDDFLGADNRLSRRSSLSSSMSLSAQSSSDDDDADVLPAIASFEGALMFVDITGSSLSRDLLFGGNIQCLLFNDSLSLLVPSSRSLL